MGYADSSDERAKKSRREWYYRNREHAIKVTQSYREKNRTKVCGTCGETKRAEEFNTKIQNGRTYLRFECKKCKHKRDKQRPSGILHALKRRETVSGRLKVSRQDPDQRAKWILRDSAIWDRKKGYICDLDEEFITDLLENGCFYCGAKEGLLTLDRIYNDHGHTKNNVNPSCYRCNQLRRDMPYEAWLLIVPGVRRAQQAGTFGTWMKEAISRKVPRGG